MASRLLRVALTGGIATGKSSCLETFRARGLPVIDADQLARDVVAQGTPGHAAVVARFGSILDSRGDIDRARLARLVFADREARQDLERIVHPLVYGRITQWYDALQAAPPPGAAAVADVPLLYETGHAEDFDVVVVAACPDDEQLRRVMSRDGLSEDDARARIAAQWPIARKRELADYVIDTSGTRESTARQVSDVIEALGRRR